MIQLTRGATAVCVIVGALALAQPVGALPQQVGGAITEQSTKVDVPPALFAVSVPTIEAEGSSVDDAALKAIFNGDISGHADALAALNAKRIHIPELTMHFNIPDGTGTTESGDVIYRDVSFDDVTAGVAAAASIGAIEVSGSDGTTMALGKMATSTFDIGGLLAFYGLVPGSPEQPMKTIYKDFSFAGGTFVTPDVSCSIGTATEGEFRARPLKTSIAELIAIASRMEAEGANPTAETIGQFVGFYADLFYAVESTPTEFSGLDCSGTTDDGKPLVITVGKMTMGGFSAGRYPEFSVNDVKISAEGDGRMSLASFTFKAADLSGPIAVLADAGGRVDDAWFNDNARRLVPAFEGLSFSGFSMDIPDGEHSGRRFKAEIGDFDLSLANYVNGIPTRIASKASGVIVPVPTDSTDEQVKMLLELGVTEINAGYEVSAAWDQPTQTIKLDKLSLSGADLGAITITALLGGAGDDLFGNDVNLAMMAATQGLTVKQITLELKNDGAVAIALQQGAALEGKDPASYPSAISGLIEGAILSVLGSSEETRRLSAAAGDFVAGKANSVSITINANAPDGISMDALMAAAADPTVLAGKVTITGGSQ